jgi:glutamate carboxypeptidase
VSHGAGSGGGAGTSRGADLVRRFDAGRAGALALLAQLVDQDSPTADKAAVDRLGAMIAAEFEAAGSRVTFLQNANAGNVLRAAFGPPEGGAAGTGAGAAMLLGHLDTVWPPGEAARRPFRVDGGIATGPGVYDMKAGIALMILLARAAHDGVVRPRRPVVCLLSADEETGSPASRAHIEAEARGARYVLCLEPSNPDGGAKTARKGVGRIVLTVTGRAAHAGIDPAAGVNAIEELAAQILAVKALADESAGTTIHTGLVSGGVGKNVVPPGARCEIDVRVRTPADWERVAAAVRALTPRHPRAGLAVEAVMSHPPLVRTEQTASLLEQARLAAAEAGFTLGEGSTGGGSDGSYCAGVGAAVLDGLGVEGEGAHAIAEQVRIDRIAPRAAFLARVLETVDGP